MVARYFCDDLEPKPQSMLVAPHRAGDERHKQAPLARARNPRPLIADRQDEVNVHRYSNLVGICL
jgi:hypothetical protein